MNYKFNECINNMDYLHYILFNNQYSYINNLVFKEQISTHQKHNTTLSLVSKNVPNKGSNNPIIYHWLLNDNNTKTQPYPIYTYPNSTNHKINKIF